MDNKVKHGQFFTKNNPFIDSEAFKEWALLIPSDKTILEPFAGDCDIKKHLPQFDFKFFDIEPRHNNIIKNDSIINFPTGFDVCISNPPYLGKSRAKRMGLEYAHALQDLYLVSLEQALKHCEFVAMIIPASFTANKYFKDRLLFVDIITTNLFNDTTIPVCVAYFVPTHKKTFKLYKNGVFVDTINKKINTKKTKDASIIFNHKDGQLGLFALDSTTGKRIRFCHSSEIQKNISNSDRSITKIKTKFKITDDIIKKLNDNLEEYRYNTHDLYLTAFKGLQKNGEHRKRISYTIAKQIIGKL